MNLPTYEFTKKIGSNSHDWKGDGMPPEIYSGTAFTLNGTIQNDDESAFALDGATAKLEITGYADTQLPTVELDNITISSGNTFALTCPLDLIPVDYSALTFDRNGSSVFVITIEKAGVSRIIISERITILDPDHELDGAGTLETPTNGFSLTVDEPTDWDSEPSNSNEAFNELASRTKTAENTKQNKIRENEGLPDTPAAGQLAESFDGLDNYMKSPDGRLFSLKSGLIEYSNHTRIKNPLNASYYSANPLTGAIKIPIPNCSSTVIEFTLNLHSFSLISAPRPTQKILISGYIHASQIWQQTDAKSLSGETGVKVRFANDGAQMCVIIGDIADVHSHPTAQVSDFFAAFATYRQDTFGVQWVAPSIINDLSGYTFTGEKTTGEDQQLLTPTFTDFTTIEATTEPADPTGSDIIEWLDADGFKWWKAADGLKRCDAYGIREYTNHLEIDRPKGTKYTGLYNEVGAIKVPLSDSFTASLIDFNISLFEYEHTSPTHESQVIKCGGYTLGTGNWLSEFARSLTGSTGMRVRFGDIDGTPFLLLGDVNDAHSYLRIQVRNFSASLVYNLSDWLNWQEPAIVVLVPETDQGNYDAATNTPTLIDGTGTKGDFYEVTTAGTQDFGAGNIVMAIGDKLLYDGSAWALTDYDFWTGDVTL